MGYSSASEGEMMESEGDKATKTRPRTKDTAVDRKSRPRSPLSRSFRPLNLDGAADDYRSNQSHPAPSRGQGLDYGGGDDESNPNDNHRNDYRSRQQSPHGQKRRYEDEMPNTRNHSDPRRFQVRYESHDNGEHDRRNTYRSDRDSYHRHGRYDDRAPPGKRHQPERQRARSRSPHRSQPGPRSRRDDHQSFVRSTHESSRRRRSSTRSTTDRETGPFSSHPNDGRAVPARAHHDNQAARDEEVEQPIVVDEAKLIEERRKRREALRAKHRGQNAPLLHQALETNAASQTTNFHAEDSAPSAIASPSDAVPSQPATPASPASPASFSVSNDDELANPAQASPNSQPQDGDGPSAADYDPNMDMQEAKLQRAENAQTNDHDLHSRSSRPDVDLPAQPAETREFDMFADDDDVDVFAPEPSAGHKKDDGTQAVRIPEAKQLDRGLLDDWDDPEGYYRIILGELLDGRYHVQTNLGKGVFSAVVRALDTKTDRLVAIKVIRRQESMYKAGMKEIDILQTIAEADPDDRKHMIRLERHFEHKGHLCMVFENLSINLREVLKKFGRDIGINIKAVRSYAQQMFLGLSLLRSCQILHADLKPDNVLVNETRSQLKIADLGSAVPASDNEVTDMLVSRFYRAPEIMLGIRHDYAIDMWSIGCTLFELYTGKICFTGPTNNQMLRAIMECRGKIPNRMLKKAEFWAQHFDPDGTFLSQEIDNVARKEFVRRTNITRPNPSKELKARLFNNAKGLSPADAKELNLFADLLDKCLALDPARRITPTDALRHGFITRSGLQGK